MDIIDRPSPNFEPRKPGLPVDMLVLHYTGMESAAAALDRLCDPAAKVSAHYLIDEDGTAYRLVDESARAWHAGVAAWAGETDINGCSVGVELVNPGHEFGYRPFPEEQMAALEILAKDILTRHSIKPWRVLGHSDVAPARKQDPGELFDWPRLAAAGIGLWPGAIAAPRDDDLATIQENLAAFGYALDVTGELDPETRDVLAAFQRRFRPDRIDGLPDAECAGLAAALVDLMD